MNKDKQALLLTITIILAMGVIGSVVIYYQGI